MNLHTAVAHHTRVGIALVLLLLAACGAPDRAQPAGQVQPTVTALAATAASANRSTSADGKLPPNAKRIATTVVGAVVAGGDYLFWRDTRNPLPEQRSIYGYDLHTQTEFLVTDAPAQYGPLASDGSLVVWVAHPAGSFTTSVQAYDLRTRQVFSLRENPAQIGFGGVAIGGGVLYYVDSAPHHVGLYAYTLATQQEVLVSANGRDPVVTDGVLLWSEAVSVESSVDPLEEAWSLHLRQLTAPSAEDSVVARVTGRGGFSGYSASDNHIMWTQYYSAGVSIYAIDTKTQSTILAENTWASHPILRGKDLVWTTLTTRSANSSPWSIHKYNLQDGSHTTIVESEMEITTWGIAVGGRLIFSVVGETGARNLHIIDLEQRGLHLTRPISRVDASQAALQAVIPNSRVRKVVDSNLLYDGSGVWKMKGVQFIVPQAGINGNTFHDSDYAAALADGTIDYWLDKAQNYLHANLLRIFVDLPQSGTTPTSIATPTSSSPSIPNGGATGRSPLHWGSLHSAQSIEPHRRPWAAIIARHRAAMEQR